MKKILKIFKNSKYLNTLFLTWYLLCLFKFLNFDFRVDLSKLFWISFIIFGLFLFLEIILDFKKYQEIFYINLQKTKKFYLNKYKIFKDNNNFVKLSKFFLFKRLFLLRLFVLTIFIAYDYLTKNIFKKNYLFAICLAVVIFDIIFVKLSVDIFFFLFIIAWIILVRMFKFSGNVLFYYSFILLIFCGLFISLKETNYIDKTSVWIFLLLTLGIFQNIFSSLKKIKEN